MNADSGPAPLSPDTLAHEAEVLAAEIGKLLAGRRSMVMGAALADVVSTWLAAHQPAEYRAILLKDWLHLMLNLVPVNEADILDRHGRRRGEPN